VVQVGSSRFVFAEREEGLRHGQRKIKAGERGDCLVRDRFLGFFVVSLYVVKLTPPLFVKVLETLIYRQICC